ncbi:MAG: hypothetical protein LLG00_13850 [Planctomycetaceae bacterium]|nr:hypothetical protein [Planctomycetaceae bacterium]
MPSVVYNALYRPTVIAAYRPVAACGPCAGGCGTCRMPVVAAYPQTSYHPWRGTYETRLVPYTTYQATYAAPVTYAAPAYSPCMSCGVAGCGPAGCNVGGGCPSCSAGAGAAPLAAPEPTPAAPTPAVPATPPPSNGTPYGVPPANTPTPIPSLPTPEASTQTPRTFQEGANKPAVGPDQGVPQSGDLKQNSMPAPSLPDPNNRRVASAVSAAPRVQTASWRTTSAATEDDGWRPSRQ